MGSLALRPDDSLAILTMALSIGFRNSVSFLSAIQATGLLTFAPVGLPPTEHASLRWTHPRARLVQSRAVLCASVVIIEGFPALSSTLLAFVVKSGTPRNQRECLSRLVSRSSAWSGQRSVIPTVGLGGTEGRFLTLAYC